MRRATSGHRRKCPKCGGRTAPFDLENVEVDLCFDCMGMWFDAGELSRAAGLRFNARATGESLAGATRTGHRCPRCAVPLYEREIDEGSGILVDQCPNCSGLFLDRDEFSQTRSYYRALGVREKERPQQRERPERPTYYGVEADEDSTGTILFQLFTGLPIEVNVPTRTFPFVTIALLLLNTAILVMAMAGGLGRWVTDYGMVPDDILHGRRLYTFLTSMFLHGGIAHLVGNMYFLYVVGDNVEDRLGHWKFLGFYLLCGLIADLAHVIGHPNSMIPTVGASGAISGVMGAYVVLFPGSRFVIRIFWFFWYHVKIPMPAWVYFGFWIAFQVVCAALDLPGIAWWAHLGGFACGVAVGLTLRALDRNREELSAATRGY